MSPIRWEAGEPVCQGRPAVLVAVRYVPGGGVARVRSAVRGLSDDGWRGVWLADAEGDLGPAAAEAARRAGLAVLVDPGSVLAEALAKGGPAADEGFWRPVTDAMIVPDALAAFAKGFAGARVIAGAEPAVRGLRQYLELADNPAAWSPAAAAAGWQARAGVAESGWFSAASDDLTLPLADDFTGTVHWLEPRRGQIIAQLTPPPGEPLLLRGDGGPRALYVGPNRFVPDETETAPGEA